MSDRRQFGWKSGRLISSPLARFWQPPATLDDADPQVPSLPLLTATVAATAGIIALAFGYFEHAPEAEIDSYVGTVIEQPSAPATHEAVVYYVLGEAIEAEDIEDSVSQPLPAALLAPAADDYIAQVWSDLDADQPQDAYTSLLIHVPVSEAVDTTEIPPPVLTDPQEPDELQDAVLGLLFEDPPETPAVLVLDFPDEIEQWPDVEESVTAFLFEAEAAPDLTQIPPPVVTDPDEGEQTEDSLVTGVTEDPPGPQPDYIVQVWTDPEPDAPIDAYTSVLLLLEQPPAADLTQIPDPVLTDLAEVEDIPDSLVSFLFENAEQDAALGIDFPDHEDIEPLPDAVIVHRFEDAPAPDLTFVPGWQDDYLRAYEQERDEGEEFALLGMVFDPYAQVDDPPPVVPVESCFIPPFRRRRR